MLISGGAVIPPNAAEILRNDCKGSESASNLDEKVSTMSSEKMG
jgi:hypothetical protein